MQNRNFADAIFIVTEEQSCPLYNVGEELKVANYCIELPQAKPTCMILTEKLIELTSQKQSFERFSPLGVKKNRFQCGGCQGRINFEYKKEKGFSTVQMRLLSETEERKRRQHLDRFFGRLRSFNLFESLDDDALSDLTALLDLKTFSPRKVVLKKGEPGTHLFFMLSGKVAVVADDGQKIAEMDTGEIFGEMSLLSGEPVSASIHTMQETEVALLSNKNFKFVLKKYPVLQLFLLKVLVNRAQAMALRSGSITSGMSGELGEINVVELFQLINSSQKTGSIDLVLNDGKGSVFFNEGEIVHAQYKRLVEKEALFILMGKESGHFTYTKGIPQQFLDQPPFGGFMSLVMEGVQWVDEQGGGEEGMGEE
jgi:CRP/FNR family transcriptional regulator, cyclic AMP receptor protein